MSEYIERQKAIEALNELRWKSAPQSGMTKAEFFYADAVCRGITLAMDALEEIPAVEVTSVLEREEDAPTIIPEGNEKMGAWEELPPACNGSMLVRCTNCHRMMSDRDIGMVRHFCPNCGAKMDGEDGDGDV